MNHKRCVLYQDLISTYHKSCAQNLVISAKSEHRVLILTLRQGTIKSLQELHSKYVLVPADKASGSVQETLLRGCIRGSQCDYNI